MNSIEGMISRKKRRGEWGKSYAEKAKPRSK
jgi:hypothetical protein